MWMRFISSFRRLVLPPFFLLVLSGGLLPLFGSGFDERARLILEYTADQYKPPGGTNPFHSRGLGDPEKYVWPMVIARYALYGPGDPDGIPLQDATTSVGVRASDWVAEGADRNPFHFILAGTVRILGLYGDYPAVEKAAPGLILPALERKDDFNPFTAEGTENHINMSRTSGYLLAQEAIRREIGENAQVRKDAMRAWILDWSDRVLAVGTGEWDSSIYGMYNILGWLNLFDFAEDPAVVTAARRVLDHYAAALALKYQQGFFAGAELRGSGEPDPFDQAIQWLGWLWFGDLTLEQVTPFLKGTHTITTVHAATSRYRPPQAIQALALKDPMVRGTYLNGKPDYLLRQAAESIEVFHIGDGFLMGSASTPYGGWTGATFQLVPWKLIVQTEDPLRPAFFTGGSAYRGENSRKGLKPWDQFAQDGPVLFQMTRVPPEAGELVSRLEEIIAQWDIDWRRDFLERWEEPDPYRVKGQPIKKTPGDLEKAPLSVIHASGVGDPVREGSAAFWEIGALRVIVKTLSGNPPVWNANAGHLVDAPSSPNGLAGFSVEVVPLARTALPEMNVEGLRIFYQTTSGDNLEVDYAESGNWVVPMVDFGYGVTKAVSIMGDAPWFQPEFPAGPGNGRIPSLKRNGIPFSRNPGTVFNGPGLYQVDGILIVRTPSGYYRTE